MDIAAFWQTVDRARRQVVDPSDGEALAVECSALLATRPSSDIVAAQQIFWDLMADSHRYDLWAAASLINGGCSNDGFEYFRGWLIMQGRAIFEAALADPDSLADLPAVRAAAVDLTEFECEDALGIARDAYRMATGEDMPQDAFLIRYGDPGDGSAFEDDVMARRLPRLVALFAG
jgi:hypothetical protein